MGILDWVLSRDIAYQAVKRLGEVHRERQLQAEAEQAERARRIAEGQRPPAEDVPFFERPPD